MRWASTAPPNLRARRRSSSRRWAFVLLSGMSGSPSRTLPTSTASRWGSSSRTWARSGSGSNRSTPGGPPAASSARRTVRQRHVMQRGGAPRRQRGQAHGAAEERNAKAAGYLPAANLWQDLEGVSSTSKPQDVIDYCNEWGNAVIAAGFLHGLYVGYDAILSAQELYALPTVRSYWSDFGNRSVAIRGFAMKQLTNDTVIPDLPFPIDLDLVHADMLGARPTWMMADGIAV